jgi:hypothetical protein
VWRGQCLDEFCPVERHLSLALIKLRAEPAYRAMQLPAPHLFGKKLGSLRLLCEFKGRLKQRSTLLQALDGFCEYLDLRAHVCHGALTITVGSDGEPYYLFSLILLSKKTSRESKLAISKSAAKRIRQSLAVAASNLTNELKAVTSPFLSHADQQRKKGGPKAALEPVALEPLA